MYYQETLSISARHRILNDYDTTVRPPTAVRCSPVYRTSFSFSSSRIYG
jgi:hypothetical protein